MGVSCNDREMQSGENITFQISMQNKMNMVIKIHMQDFLTL